MDLEKAYDMVERQVNQEALILSGVDGKLLKAVQTVCNGEKALYVLKRS